MRWCMVAAFVVFGSLAHADAGHDWSVDLPKGWTTDPQLADKARKDAGNAEFLHDVYAWHAPDDMTSLLLLQAGVFQMDSQAEVREFDRGVLKPAKDAGATVTDVQPLHAVGDMMVAESTLEMAGGVHGRWLRKYIAAKDGTHLVVAMCFGADAKPPCGATLDTMKFAVAGATSFESRSDDNTSDAERIGKGVGALVVIVGVIAFIVRRKKTA